MPQPAVASPPERIKEAAYAPAALAIGPDGRSFASVQRNGFFTVGITTLDTWLAGNPAGLNLAPSLMRVLRAVSRNEGRLEAVNSWDTAFLSFGMFQWTAGACCVRC